MLALVVSYSVWLPVIVWIVGVICLFAAPRLARDGRADGRGSTDAAVALKWLGWALVLAGAVLFVLWLIDEVDDSSEAYLVPMVGLSRLFARLHPTNEARTNAGLAGDGRAGGLVPDGRQQCARNP